MQIQTLINWAVSQLNSDTPHLDAEVLLAFVLNKPRVYLRTWSDKCVNDEQLKFFSDLIQQRIQGIPIAYLTGTREFWSRDFKITPDVLIPRPDTELLIELCLTLIKNQALSVLDLGTGSGIIAITLAAECPSVKMLAVDNSESALIVAKYNADQYQLTNIEFCQSNWFSTIAKQQFDLIVSNPPYIAEYDEHLNKGDLRFEPKSALISDNHGLNDIEHIANNARDYLNNNGYLLVEHGYNQAQAVQTIFKTADYQHIKTYYDLSEQARVTLGVK